MKIIAFAGAVALAAGFWAAPALAPADAPASSRSPSATPTPILGEKPKEAKPAKGKDKDKPEERLTADTLAGLKFRGIGPALTGGRVSDFAVTPGARHRYFVAVASGGVWKTENGGTTFAPIFDDQGSYSIGCLALDPANPHVLWVGTGENNSQRSVAFGDGVYRTRDGGAHWENLGLKESEHIGMIAIDPRDSDVVYVAAQGPLWRSGGDRGLYKTTDGGATWQRVLFISDDTGVNEVHLDPRHPDVVYASAYQRRRHVWTLVNGGPESALYQSTDAGQTWRKLKEGLPEVDLGRIGLDLSPADPDVVYAIVEAADGKGGFFRSRDRGATWERRSDYQATSPQYYNEIVCDPVNVDRVYVLDTVTKVSVDGGKTFSSLFRPDRHVDDHAIWIDPQDTDYLLIGGDGGVYESFDRGEAWRFMGNMPITQFYRATADESRPFYFVYGGTQDNNTLGGPSRTRNPAGIVNEDWFVTVGGDGFKPQIDPEDPNIVYSQWQHAGLVRYDRRTGEIADIKPREAPGDAPNRWNWDSPLIISPHHSRRLYFAAQRVFRSDDRGDSWVAVSGDLTRQRNRNALEVMGRIQPADAIAKHDSTSFYGNIVALAESPLVEGLLYAGTDDGLVQVSEDAGQTWRKIEKFPGVPEFTYVSALVASQHEADTVYAAFDNHKSGDFKPYVLRSRDRGKSWKAAAGDLPDREVVYALAEDHENPALLFAGTEFGIYCTLDGGQKWLKLKGGMPTIAVRDISIQKRERDLVLATFGRGIYILDDYAPLRTLSAELLEQEGVLFPVKDAYSYVETSRLGGRSGRGWQGTQYFAAPNPPFGAVFTYYLKDKLTTRRERRHEAEKKALEAKEKAPYPTFDELRAEDEEQDPSVVFTVRDESGAVVRRLTGPRDKGLQRVAWDLRWPAADPIALKSQEEKMPWDRDPVGPLVAPGTYTVAMARQVDGALTALGEAQSFQVLPLGLADLPETDRRELVEFATKVARLQRAVMAAGKSVDESRARLKHIAPAILATPQVESSAMAEARELDLKFLRLATKLRGDETLRKRNEPTSPAIAERVGDLVDSLWHGTSAPTRTQRDVYQYAADEFAGALTELRALVEQDLAGLEARLEAAGAPWTPGRLPTWERD